MSVISFRKFVNDMSKNKQQPTKVNPDDTKLGQRSIRLERYIWKALDEEARACGRTPLQQLRQLMLHYFDFGAVEIDTDRLTYTKQVKAPDQTSKTGRLEKTG